MKLSLRGGDHARTLETAKHHSKRSGQEMNYNSNRPLGVDEASAVNGNKYVEQVREAVKEEGAEILIVICR